MVRMIDSYIFCWPGHVKSTCNIESQIPSPVTVINSSDSSDNSNWVNIGPEAYFTNQFQECLNRRDNDKILLHIQGDTSYNQWDTLMVDAVKYMKEYNAGVYYPFVKNTSWSPDKMSVVSQCDLHENIKYIACGDETVWFIHPDIMNRCESLGLFKLFDGMKYGYGWDLIICAVSHLMNRAVIRDYNHVIEHSNTTGYEFHDAFVELKSLLKTLPADINNTITSMQENHRRTMKL